MTADSMSFRAKSRNGANGVSDMDGYAARAAARESGDERVQSVTISEISRDVSRSTRCARSGQALNMAAVPLLNGCNVTLPLDMTNNSYLV